MLFCNKFQNKLILHLNYKNGIFNTILTIKLKQIKYKEL